MLGDALRSIYRSQTCHYHSAICIACNVRFIRISVFSAISANFLKHVTQIYNRGVEMSKYIGYQILTITDMNWFIAKIIDIINANTQCLTGHFVDKNLL